MKEILIDILIALGGSMNDIAERTNSTIEDILLQIRDTIQANAGNEIFTEDITLKIENADVWGKYHNNDVIAATGKTVKQVVLDALQKTIHPNYQAPTTTLQSNQATNGLEIGTSLNITLTALFNQNNGGASAAVSIKKDGVQISNANNYIDNNVLISAVPKVYTATFDYAQGAVLNNNLGNPDATGRIEAGTTPPSNNISYRGYYKIFFDALNAVPANSADVRGMANNFLAQDAQEIFALNTGNAKTIFAFWLPPGRNLISVVDADALNLDITAQYTLTNNFNVNDAAGNAVAGKLFVMQQSIPYSTNHRHIITTN